MKKKNSSLINTASNSMHRHASQRTNLQEEKEQSRRVLAEERMRNDPAYKTGDGKVSVTASNKNSIDYDDVQSSMDDSNVSPSRKRLMLNDTASREELPTEKKSGLP